MIRSAIGCLSALYFLILSHCSEATGQTAEIRFVAAPGLEVVQVADESLVKWPVVADWDNQGRLVVVESAGVSKPIEKHNEQLLHTIVRLVDDDHDGVFDRRILAADKLAFTEGVLCLGDDMLISAPPHIWKLTDADNDGYCESRQIWFDGQTLTGCANDLHGPYLGRDGWIYWCKGAFAKQTHELMNGKSLADGAAHIHRRRLFGTNIPAEHIDKIDTVMSGGMDNPVEVASLQSGERFFTSTFLVHPGDGKRDGVAHAVYGGAYGKDHAALAGVVRTGPLMPITSHLGAAAPSGLICLDSDKLVSNGSHTLVAALFNLQKVVGLTMEPVGASFRTQPMDLLVGDRVDFHPTDVIEDADGSLLVIDTGGWYDLCCPTSRVDQFTAPGGIYRLQKTNSKYKSHRDQRPIVWESVTADQAIELIQDDRPWVARQAFIKIASSGDWATSKLASALTEKSQVLSLTSRSRILWALGSIGTPQALQIVSQQIEEATIPASEPQLQQIACHLLSLYGYRPANQSIEKLVARSVQEKSWATARVAIEALGRIGDANSIELLMAQPWKDADRFVDHSLRYALFELDSASVIAPFLTSEDSAKRRLALTTLDLLQDTVHLSSVVLSNAANDQETSEVAAELLVKRPQLASDILAILGPQWSSSFVTSRPSVTFEKLAVGWRDQAAWQQFIADKFATAKDQVQFEWKEALLKSRAGSHIPPAWFAWIKSAIDQDPQRVAGLLESVNLTGAEQVPLVEYIQNMLKRESNEQSKLQLLLSLPPNSSYVDAALLTRLIELLNNSVDDRAANQPTTATLLRYFKRLKIDSQTAEQILALSPKLSPADLIQAIELIAGVHNDALDEQTLDKLVELKAARAIPTNTLSNIYRDRRQELRKKAKGVADRLLQSDPEVKKTVQALLTKMPDGDPIRGLTIYHSSKANCGTCHQMGYRGGKIGPELSKIGGARTPEALLEAILYPSQRIEQGFTTTRLLTTDGRVLNGIILNRSAQEITLRVSAEKVESIAAADIEEERPSEVSIMPAGMLELLSQQELADLLSLLQAAK